MDSINKEAHALDELKVQATKHCADKRVALRKLENQALERKNRCNIALCPHFNARHQGRGVTDQALCQRCHTARHIADWCSRQQSTGIIKR